MTITVTTCSALTRLVTTLLAAATTLTAVPSAHAADIEIRVTVTGRDADDTLPLLVCGSSWNGGPWAAISYEAPIDGNGQVTFVGAYGRDIAPPPFGCFYLRAWLLPQWANDGSLPNELLTQMQMHARYAGTQAVAAYDVHDDLWSIEIALTPACDLRLRVLDDAGEPRNGLAWTGFGDCETDPFGPFSRKQLDGTQLQRWQARLLGLPRGEDLRVWLHDRSAGAVGLNAALFEPVDVPGDQLDDPVAEIDLTWTPTPVGDVGRVQFTGLYDWRTNEEGLRSLVGPGRDGGRYLCVSVDRQRIVLVASKDETLTDPPYVPDQKLRLGAEGVSRVVSTNCLRITFSADLPAGTWDVLPGDFRYNDGPTLRRFLADPAGLPGPFPGITRITVAAGQTQSVDLGFVGEYGSNALPVALWCGPASIHWGLAQPGVGIMPLEEEGPANQGGGEGGAEGGEPR